MFTGLVSERGQAVSIARREAGAELTVRAPKAASGATLGDSIAVNGACLTVTRIDGDTLTFDLSGETMRATALGALRAGAHVNIEQALRASDRLGGHIVTGHVDAVGTVRSTAREGQHIKYEIASPKEVLDCLVPKGSVAVDGISLTVVDVGEGYFTLVIIPHTEDITNIGHRKPGDPVNLESDIIGKYVRKFLAGASGGAPDARSDAALTDALRRGGFMT